MTAPYYLVAFELARERSNQVLLRGWTAEHDDAHTKGELARAAMAYTIATLPNAPAIETSKPPSSWPWHFTWWKPRNRRRALVKAGALIIAEIERLDRLEAANVTGEQT